MTRRIRTDDWVRTPEFEAAYRRTLDTAWQCSGLFWGETLPADPRRDGSARALVTTMAMMLFLHRLDPKDAALLFAGPGSLADLYKPYPPDFSPLDGGFGDLWPPRPTHARGAPTA